MQRQDSKFKKNFFVFFSYPAATEWSDPASEADPVEKSYSSCYFS